MVTNVQYYQRSIVVEYLTRMYNSSREPVVSIFLDFKQGDIYTSDNLLANLLKQLLQSQTDISDKMQDLYRDHLQRGTRPKYDELIKMLKYEIGQVPAAYIIVDALDESPEDTRGELLRALQSLPPNARLLITSRPLASIVVDLEGAERFEILANDSDIRNYIESRIPRERRLARHVNRDSYLLEAITSTIVSKSRGM